MRIKGSNMAEEIFDIIDENGKPTGETVTRSQAHAEEFIPVSWNSEHRHVQRRRV